MKRNASAQAGEGKLESRFAALTSGLLARKGFAAPSNSPVQDPAEETDAFALEPTRKNAKPKAVPTTPAASEEKSGAKNVADAATPKKKSEPEKVQKPAPESKPSSEIKPSSQNKSEGKAAVKGDAPMMIINERSYEAGYPDNPTPEEIAALEAEANEVVSYFENFGTEDDAALEKDDFYGIEGENELEELDDLAVEPAPTAPPAGPWAGASVPAVSPSAAFEVRAGVSVQLTAREFMRLSLGAAELEQSAQELIVAAIEEYLDARGVLSLGGCSCLESLAKSPAKLGS